MEIQPIGERAVGIELTSTSIKVAVVVVERGSVKVERLIEVDVEKGGDEGGGIPLLDACRIALAGLESEILVSSLPPGDVWVRQLRLSLKRDKEIDAVLDFQVEALLPFPLEEVLFDRVVLSRDAEGANLVVLTVRKERLSNHLDELRRAGVEPERTSCPQAALAALLYRLLPSEEPQGILHVSSDATVAAIVRGGKVVAARSLSLGSLHLLEGLPKEESINLYFPDPAQAKKTSSRAESYRGEIGKTFLALTSKKHQGIAIGQIFLSGDIARLHNLSAYLAQGLDVPIAEMPERSPFCAPLGDVASFAVPLGLGLSALSLDVTPVNFRKREFGHPRPWRRLQKGLIAYFSLCVLLAGAILALGKAVGLKREGVIVQEFNGLAALTLHSQEEGESKQPAPPAGQRLPSAELLRQAQEMAGQFKGNRKSFPLLPDLPRVGDLLGWLGSHPATTVKDPISGEVRSAIRIDGLQYSMCKRPGGKNPGEHYQVRIELDFSSESPAIARDFHDALLASSDFVDPTLGVKWSGQGGHYHASFFLLDRTKYREAANS